MTGRCILVLGSGRSGTSAVAGALHALGVNMGAEFMPADDNNKWGTFEDREWFGNTRAFLAGQVGADVYRDMVKARAGQALWGIKDPALVYVAQLALMALRQNGVEVRAIIAKRNGAACRQSFARAYNADPRKVAEWWDSVSLALADQRMKLINQYVPVHEVQFEELLQDPAGVVRGLAGFVLGDEIDEGRLAAAIAHVQPAGGV